MTAISADDQEKTKRQSEKRQQILDAVVAVIGSDGVAGVSMRAVSKYAEVSLGLVNYYFRDKESLIAAALRHIGDEDLQIVAPTPGVESQAQLSNALRLVASDRFLGANYLAQRLQLWSLASVSPLYAKINHEAQTAYRDGLAQLLAAARTDLAEDEISKRAADILVIQNGIWLTSILIVDLDAIERSIVRCEEIAFG